MNFNRNFILHFSISSRTVEATIHIYNIGIYCIHIYNIGSCRMGYPDWTSKIGKLSNISD